VVDITIKRKDPPEPDPAPTRHADGAGWIVSSPTCGKQWAVGRAEIMAPAVLPVGSFA
jgi:hypothetical protein